MLTFDNYRFLFMLHSIKRFLFMFHSTVHCIYLIMLLSMNKISSSSSIEQMFEKKAESHDCNLCHCKA